MPAAGQTTKPARISKIRLCKFRGATGTTDLEFDPKKQVVMVFGENGTGKSTLVDAIDFVCNRTTGSLAERSSTTPSKHLPSVGSKASDLCVEIECDGCRWKGTWGGRDVAVSGPEGCPTAHILRRSQLLRFIEAQPAKRFEELRPFIDVNGVEACEQSLTDAARVAKQRYDEAVSAKVDADKALNDLWMAEGRPGADALSWAEAKAAADTTALEAQQSALNNLLTILDATAGDIGNLDEAEDDARAKNDALTGVREQAAAAPAVDSGAALDIVDILEKGKAFLVAKPGTTSCPLCENGVDPAALAARIDYRLSEMKEIRTLNDQLRQASRAAEIAAKHLETCQGAVKSAGAKLSAAVTAAVATNIADFPLEQVSSPSVTIDAEGRATDVGQVRQLAEYVTAAASLASLRDRISTDLSQFNAIRLHRDRILGSDERIRDAEAVHARLEQAVELVRSKRIAFTEDVLDRVNNEVNRLYTSLHPGEPIGNIRLYLDPNRKGSLHHDSTFLGESGVPPQAYFSESHLDTLGFCIFLAVAKHYSGGGGVVVLDDIFTSVDAVHLSRIIELLADEGANFDHLIVTTHFRQWRDRYRLSQAPGRSIQMIELSRWSKNSGVRVYSTKMAVDDLSGKLASEPFDRQGVANHAGVLLEAVLDHLALIYRCHLPHSRDANYTLGELLDSISKLSKTLTITRTGSGGKSVERNIKPLYDGVNGLSFIRNQVGCHFSAAGADISDTDVELFGKQTLELVSALVCPNCGSLATRRSGDYFACACRGIEMRPLERP